MKNIKKNETNEYRRRLSKRLKNSQGEMTQREFAKKLNIAQATLSRFIECTQGASLDSLEQICKGLKVDIVELFSKE